MEAKQLYSVAIYNKLHVSILACSKYHAIDQMYNALGEIYKNRKKYTAKLIKV